MDPPPDEHTSNALLLYELSELIERGDEQGVADFLALHSDLETVFLPFPSLQLSQKVLLPSVFYAVKKSMQHILLAKSLLKATLLLFLPCEASVPPSASILTHIVLSCRMIY